MFFLFSPHYGATVRPKKQEKQETRCIESNVKTLNLVQTFIANLVGLRVFTRRVSFNSLANQNRRVLTYGTQFNRQRVGSQNGLFQFDARLSLLGRFLRDIEQHVRANRKGEVRVPVEASGSGKKLLKQVESTLRFPSVSLEKRSKQMARAKWPETVAVIRVTSC